MKYIKRFFNFLWNEIPSRFSTIFGVLYVFFYLWFYIPLNKNTWLSKEGEGIIIAFLICASIIPTACVGIFFWYLFILENKGIIKKIKENWLTKNKFCKFLIIFLFSIFILMINISITAVIFLISTGNFLDILEPTFYTHQGIKEIRAQYF